MKRKPVAIIFAVAGFLFLLAPRAFAADSLISRFVFITDPQSVVSGAVSGELRIQAQDALGNPVSAGKTLCLGISSTSKTGEFSSNSDNWNPVNALTINSNWTARAFYYKDPSDGDHRIDASIAVKPEGTTCSVWPVTDWSIQWSARQNIIVGTGGALSPIAPSVSSSAAASPASGASAYRAPVAALPPVPTIQASAGEDRVVLAGVEENFIGEAVGLVREPITNARFWWNFGDGETREGRSVGHIYREPGIYTVVLSVSSGEYAASDYAVARVMPNKIAIAGVTTGESGAIRIVNPAPIAADIGGWILEDDQGKKFFLPLRTVIGAQGEVAFANRVTGLSPDAKATLRYPGGSSAAWRDVPTAQNGEEKTGAKSSAPSLLLPSLASAAIGASVSSRGENPRETAANKEGAAAASSEADAFLPISAEEAASSTIGKQDFYFPGKFFIAAFALSALAAAGFFLVRRLF